MSGDAWQVPTVVGSARRRLGGTVRDRAARELRDRILVGDLASGSRIDLDQLAAEFGTSRTPVREACLELAHEGLVRVAPRSGVTVIGVTPEDTVENFAVMAVLSGVAAAWAAERITPDELKVVRGLRTSVIAAVESEGDIATANWEFHRAINRASRSPRLLRLLSQTGRMIPMSFFRVFPEQIPCSLEDHDALVDALTARDPASARKVTERHFAESGRLVSAHLEAGDWTPATRVLGSPM
ncbi:MAG: GntR family transcriptional regulator [Nocardioidaceae bacterium]